MSGSNMVAILAPVVALPLMAFWLIMVFHADSHPGCRHRPPLPVPDGPHDLHRRGDRRPAARDGRESHRRPGHRPSGRLLPLLPRKPQAGPAHWAAGH